MPESAEKLSRMQINYTNVKPETRNSGNLHIVNSDGGATLANDITNRSTIDEPNEKSMLIKKMSNQNDISTPDIKLQQYQFASESNQESRERLHSQNNRAANASQEKKKRTFRMIYKENKMFRMREEQRRIDAQNAKIIQSIMSVKPSVILKEMHRDFT